MTPSYALGLLFILLVALIWAAASILVQHLYNDLDFHSPFILTYICTSLFVILLPTRLIWERFRSLVCINTKNGSATIAIVPFRSGPPPEDDAMGEYVQLEVSSSKSAAGTTEEECVVMEMEGSEERIRMETNGTAIPSKTQDVEATSISDPEKESTISSLQPTDPLHYQEAAVDTIETRDIPPTTPSDQSNPFFILGHYETFQISLRIAPIWFIGNFAYNVSLKYTSITSSTVLASTSSLFTFLFAVSCRDEKFTPFKLAGVILCMLGSIATSIGDADDDQQQQREEGAVLSVFGDALGLISALGYGAYTVLIRLLCPKKDEYISMQLLFGYIGLLNMIALFPIACFSLYTKSDDAHLTWMVLFWLVLKGLFDNVLSDYLWARAVVLTSATVATVGLGLTIPLAFASDWTIGGENPTVEGVVGAVLVLVGFVLVNVGS